MIWYKMKKIIIILSYNIMDGNKNIIKIKGTDGNNKLYITN